MFSTITLALDGIITDTTYLHYESFLHAFDFFDYTLPNNLSFQEQMTFRKNDWLDAIDHLSNSQKNDIIQKKNEYYLVGINDLTDDDLYPGIKELFNEAEYLSIIINCYSNNPLAKDVLKNLGLNPTTHIMNFDDLNNQSSDIIVIDNETDLTNQSSLLFFLTQDDTKYQGIQYVQNTEELTMAYFKKIWEEQI
ncbi:HAD family phosphatase [Vagococcus bubulae]|uniref:Haloacid dehalogenase n=1 Tax=Vagococcus bubulae TaxID=1977868 RepID=A0A429ZQC6_9ENTE|nr:HAD family phosphatase [Vagococcus bubulae]RST95920.1 hypothetical protein CBF36_01760 [Vagococcus bubulae]